MTSRTPPFTWRKRNTTVTEYVSTYPADVWVIRRCTQRKVEGKLGWLLKRASRNGDAYMVVGCYPTLKAAKSGAEGWEP